MPDLLDSQPDIDTAVTIVTLCDGTQREIGNLDVPALRALQWEQEPEFAKQIAQSPRKSPERAAVIRQAYETVCTILDEISRRSVEGKSLAMGMDPRYSDLVLRELRSQRKRGIHGGLFELGFGSGILLSAASHAGFRVGGLEVASQLHAEAADKVSPSDVGNLLLGDFLSVNLTDHLGRYSVAYWNDVFEHIPVDEISEYLERLHAILAPGGKLITITPNWHMRPSDITGNFCPSRTPARGFHMQEYTLGEVVRLLHRAGFQRVSTPAFITRKAIYSLPALDLTWAKILLEPMLELLPFRLAVQACRRLGLSCTIAVKNN